MSSTTSQSMLEFFTSSIGKKQVMAITGLGLIGFCFAHLTGNFLLLLGPDAFNLYGHKLTSTPLIYVAEAGLLAMFLIHIGLAFNLTLKNHLARPQKYYMKTRTGRGETISSATMPYTGLVLLVFIILHLINFKYGTYYTVIIDGQEVRDLYRVVIEYFANPLYVAWYVFAMCCLGLHLSHGFQSTFQSFGWNHSKYMGIVQKLGYFVAFFLAAGFSGLAIWSYFQN